MPSDRSWIAARPPQLEHQRRAIPVLLDLCEESPLVTSLSVGWSRAGGAADALSEAGYARRTITAG